MSEEMKKNRLKDALELRAKGYNCCQAVCCAFADQVDVDKRTLFRISEGFGSGMGGMDGTCGAISAAVLLSGLKCSTGCLEAPNSKAVSYKDANACIQDFKEQNSSLVCRDLKGVDTHMPLRSCPDCIGDAIAIIQARLFPDA